MVEFSWSRSQHFLKFSEQIYQLPDHAVRSSAGIELINYSWHCCFLLRNAKNSILMVNLYWAIWSNYTWDIFLSGLLEVAAPVERLRSHCQLWTLNNRPGETSSNTWKYFRDLPLLFVYFLESFVLLIDPECTASFELWTTTLERLLHTLASGNCWAKFWKCKLGWDQNHLKVTLLFLFLQVSMEPNSPSRPSARPC